VALTVASVNDAPVAVNDAYTASEDVTLSSPHQACAATIRIRRDVLTSSLVGQASHGTVDAAERRFRLPTCPPPITAARQLYLPRHGRPGQLERGERSPDRGRGERRAAGGQTTATATAEDMELTVAAPGVLANDSDAEARADRQPGRDDARGLLTFNADGSFTYLPSLNFNGTDSFTYRVSDAALNSNVATVTLTVAAVNGAPVLQDDRGSTDEDQPMTFLASQLLGNDAPGPAVPAGTADNELSQTLTVVSVSAMSAQGGHGDLQRRLDYVHAAGRLLWRRTR